MKLISHLMLAMALTASAASAFAQDAKAAPAKPDPAKGEASFAACVACHGADGNSTTPTFPKLAQQHPQYIVKQLQEFKSGKRNNAVMKPFATALSDADMQNIAAWLASKPGKAGFAKGLRVVFVFVEDGLEFTR